MRPPHWAHRAFLVTAASALAVLVLSPSVLAVSLIPASAASAAPLAQPPAATDASLAPAAPDAPGMSASMQFGSPLASAPLTGGGTPSPKPSTTPAKTPPKPSVKDNGIRSWSIRPAQPNGSLDNRTHYTLQGTPGTSLKDAVAITNSSDVSVTFDVYGTDAYNTPSGLFDLLAASKNPVDIGTWVKFASPTVTIGAGKTQIVPFEVDLPKTATPGDHAGGVVVSLHGTGAQAGVRLDSRVAIRVYLRVPGYLRPLLAIDPVGVTWQGSAVPLGRGTVTVTYTVSNPGNIRLSSHPVVTLTNMFGVKLGEVKPADLPELLPNSRVTFSATLKNVFPAGPITATITLAPYTDPQQPIGQAIKSITGSGSTWAISWTMLLIVIGAIMAGAGLWWWRHRRNLHRIDTAMAVARDEALATADAAK